MPLALLVFTRLRAIDFYTSVSVPLLSQVSLHPRVCACG